jgi:hypothetical protein
MRVVIDFAQSLKKLPSMLSADDHIYKDAYRSRSQHRFLTQWYPTHSHNIPPALKEENSRAIC